MTLPLPWTFSTDDPAGPELENRLQDVLDAIGQQFPVSAANLQSALVPVVGTVTVTMAALAAGGTAAGSVTGLPFNGRTPTKVIAQATTGGTIYFSNQYVIGTDTYAPNGFNILVGSGGAAFAAGWTLAVNYIAYF